MEERYTLEELEQYFSIILAIAATEKEMTMKELFSAKKTFNTLVVSVKDPKIKQHFDYLKNELEKWDAEGESSC